MAQVQRPDQMALAAQIDALLRACDAAEQAAARRTPPEPQLAPADLDAVLLIRGAPNARARLGRTVTVDRISRCVQCGAEFDLPAPTTGQPAEAWRCVACECVVLSGPTRGGEGECRPGLTRVPASNASACEALAAGRRPMLRSIVRRLAEIELLDAERRGAPRLAVSLPAHAIPLDDRDRLGRSVVRITTRDISAEGLSFFAERELRCDRLVVDLTPGGIPGAQVLLELARQRATGFLYECAGRFVLDTPSA